MRLFGLTISREKALAPVDNRDGWFPLIREPFTGAWQQNQEVKLDSVLAHSTVFRCISLIASDVAKMRLRLVAQDADGIWSETDSPAYSPVLRKPNRWQNRIQFFTAWMESKLIRGNTYVLKERDNRGVVVRLYVLAPDRVKPLVADDGSVFYELQQDALSGLPQNAVTVPASEIIHDRWNTLFHPLVGLSPIFAAGLAATQGLAIQNNSARFFTNGSQPGGVLTAPGAISDETAARLKAHWGANYTGQNVGKVAVLGDGLHYEPMAVKATDAQLIEQLKWSAETVCSVFGVPAYKVGVGTAPVYNNVEALNQAYYTDCIQIHIESVELCLDEGLGIGVGVKVGGQVFGTEFDLDDLLRMDTATQVKTLSEATRGMLMKPDEARKKLGFGKVAGGDAVYAQQQDFSLAALAKRDQSDPFAKPDTPSAPEAPVAANDDNELQAARALIALQKGLANVRR
ncbi:phage portal protein [Brevundimonas sp.]|uniref:phage portal protein n=1 Tax=Brevundimonas sp. TaxID=1871086 RepID=UPI0028AF051D|nr:phage portal protein [Brevundimonas sp.]